MGRIASFAALLIAAAISPIVGHLGGIFQFFQYASPTSPALHGDRADGHSLEAGQLCRAAIFGLVGGVIIQVVWRVVFSGRWPGADSQAALLLHRRHRRGGDHDRHRHRHPAYRPARLRQDRALRMACPASEGLRRGLRRPWYQQLKLWCGLVAWSGSISIGDSGDRFALYRNWSFLVPWKPRLLRW